MGRVVIKGEVHSSRGDFEEERELLAEGVDTLVIERSEGEAKVGWLHGWFGVAMVIFEYLFASFLYTDHQMLVDIARGQGADVVYTRETDADLLENSHRLVIGTACVLFYALIFLSALFGLLGAQWYGAVALLLAGLGPIIILRIHETRKSGDNRDKKIAEKIETAAGEGCRVVAVMGQSHAKRVPDYLSDEIEFDVREPNYGFFSLSMGRDLFLPVVRMVGMIGIVYPLFLAVFKLYLTLL